MSRCPPARVRVGSAGVSATSLEVKLILFAGIQFPALTEPQTADCVK